MDDYGRFEAELSDIESHEKELAELERSLASINQIKDTQGYRFFIQTLQARIDEGVEFQCNPLPEGVDISKREFVSGELSGLTTALNTLTVLESTIRDQIEMLESVVKELKSQEEEIADVAGRED